MARVARSMLLALLALPLSLAPVSVALAHRDPCHIWHACNPHPASRHLIPNPVRNPLAPNYNPDAPEFVIAPADPFAGYVCGDLGYSNYCLQDPGEEEQFGPHTTLSEFTPPVNLSPYIWPPPPDAPIANPAGVLIPPIPPRPPIQPDCSNDRLNTQTQTEMVQTGNDTRIQQGCILPITEPPQH